MITEYQTFLIKNMTSYIELYFKGSVEDYEKVFDDFFNNTRYDSQTFTYYYNQTLADDYGNLDDKNYCTGRITTNCNTIPDKNWFDHICDHHPNIEFDVFYCDKDNCVPIGILSRDVCYEVDEISDLKDIFKFWIQHKK